MSQNKHTVPDSQRPGRAATSRDTGRYERYATVPEHDGWDIPEEDRIFRTEVSEEVARSAINYVRSPDLPFDRSLNPYRGCEHGCIYCFARPTHAYLGLSPGLDFETRLIARPNIAEVLERELRKPGYKVAPLAIGTNTDPYQPIEQTRAMMRDILDVLARFNHPVAIVTKGTLIERDIDLLAPMAERGLASVGVSVTTLDRHLSRRMEPRVPAPPRRLKTIERLAEAGIPVRLMVSPVVPGLTDPELERIMAAGKSAGARTASWIMLRLPLEVSPLWQDWLEAHYPGRKDSIMARLCEMHGGKPYEARWGHRMRGEGLFATLIAQRFALAARRLGLDAPGSVLCSDLFEVPLGTPDQASLF
jgi:DNA repair photolyase